MVWQKLCIVTAGGSENAPSCQSTIGWLYLEHAQGSRENTDIIKQGPEREI
jgi:hypothetical protein